MFYKLSALLLIEAQNNSFRKWGQGMIVTFCGHAQISQSEKIEKWLYAVTQKLIEQGATTFYLGGYGAFD